MEGHVSNYVETEQIITTIDHAVGAFVQLRGSVPLFWRQLVNFRYQPPFEISSSTHTVSAIKKHFAYLLTRYPRLYVINLVNASGREARLAHEFQHFLGKVDFKRDQIGYLHFDFHRECAHNNWARLSLLFQKIKKPFDEYGYFLQVAGKDNSSRAKKVKASGKIQTGAFRTNCVDCLDRTNVVQGILAKEALDRILRDLQLFAPNEKVEDHHSLYDLHRNIWADNADALSLHYAATKAQKTDFTRTGVRTFMGLLMDLEKSIIRYLYANFFDGARQVS